MSTLSTEPSFVWLATGTATAFIFMRGYSLLPGLILATFMSYALQHAPLRVALQAAMILSGQAVLLLALCEYFKIPTLIVYNKQPLFIWILISIMIAGFASYSLSMVCYPYLKKPFYPFWIANFAANLNGILIVATSILTLDAYFPDIGYLRSMKRWPLLLAYSVLILFLILCILTHSPFVQLEALIGLFFMSLLISHYWGWCGAVSSLLLIGMILQSTHAPFFPLLLTVTAITSLFLGAKWQA